MKIILVFFFFCVIQQVVCQDDDSREFVLKNIFSYNKQQNSLMYSHINENLRGENTVVGYFPKISNNSVHLVNTEWRTRSPLPDIYNKNVLELFSIMSYNAYSPEDSAGWISVPGWTDYNNSYSFDPDNNHLQGDVFYSDEYDEVIISFKGTSFWGQVGTNDFTEDWLMFSCCGESAGAIPILGVSHRGCGCVEPEGEDYFICDTECFHDCIVQRGHSYYAAALSIFDVIKNMFPTADFYFTGHSLGGAIASLMSASVQFPAVTFESPPTFNYARILQLNVIGIENTHLPIFGFGAYNDPIFIGGNTCEPCISGGSPIKTECHLGYVCVWPIARDSTFGSLFQTENAHSINTVLDNVQNYDIPRCFSIVDCWDCTQYIDY